MAKYFIEDSTLTGIADAIRAKEETTDAIPVADFAERIADIQTGVDTSADTVVADALVEGYTAHDAAGNPVNGANPYGKTATDNTVNTQADLIAQIQMALGVRKISDTFSENSWEDIIWACQNKVVPDAWSVGDQKTMTIGGTDYAIDIIGKNHDTYTEGGTAPLTFQLHDCLSTTDRMNPTVTNAGGYYGSMMHIPILLNLKYDMPTEVTAAIKNVDKKASEGSMSTTIETISCGLFCLAEIEVFGSITYSTEGEGSQYDYYSEGNSKIKYLSGAATDWWLRSPWPTDGGYFCYVRSNGAAMAGEAANYKGVAPAFCF